jgi:hypothetical protein
MHKNAYELASNSTNSTTHTQRIDDLQPSSNLVGVPHG